MQENLINRKTYKEVKKMDRQEMENFLLDIYKSGFKDGVEAGDNADFKIKIIQVLRHTPGVGEKTMAKVLKTLKELEG